MALDGAFLYCIKSELEAQLVNARVDKIYQPSREEIALSLRSADGNVKLLMSAAANSARVHLTEIALENPKAPPMFCMLLRKHIGAGRLTAIRQDGLERIVCFDFACTNEMGDAVTLSLICEIMGRHSNIILCGDDGRVIDCIKRVDEEMSAVRRMLPGVRYTLPPQQTDRLNLITCTDEEILAALTLARNAELSKCLMGMLQGISPVVAREVAHYTARGADIDKDELLQNEELRSRMLFYLHKLQNALRGEKYFTLLTDLNGKPRDFSFVDINQYGTAMLNKHYESAGMLLDGFYCERDRIDRMKQRSHDLLSFLANTSERIARRIHAQQEELKECANRDQLRICGDLIGSNIYALDKGMTSCTLANFYEEGSPLMTIKLNPRLTPVQNSQRYYSEYRKADTAERKLREQILQGEQELLYIDSVFDALTRTTGESELLEIRQELAEQGYVRKGKSKGKEKPVKAQPPLKFQSADGFTILCGRNNKQNDKLTLKDAAKHDLWLHTHNIPGSHVIVVTEGAPVPDSTIEEAAQIAAYNSKARDSVQVPVDYTLVRNVKKPNGAKPGMVIFDNYKTAYVKPQERP